MLKRIPLFFMFFLLSQASLAETNDKALHFGISAVLGYGVESYLHHQTDLDENKRLIYGTLIATLPGLAKEISDSNEEGNEFSEQDLLADVAGALVGTLLANNINKRMAVSVSHKKDQTMVSLGYQF